MEFTLRARFAQLVENKKKAAVKQLQKPYTIINVKKPNGINTF